MNKKYVLKGGRAGAAGGGGGGGKMCAERPPRPSSAPWLCLEIGETLDKNHQSGELTFSSLVSPKGI